MDLITFDINGYIFLIIGVVAIAGVLLKKGKLPMKNAAKAEGVVFKNDAGAAVSFGNDSTRRTFVWIRFVTKAGEWITEELSFDNVCFTYTGQFKEGKKVNVIYNPHNPKEFLIDQHIGYESMKGIVIMIGMILIGVGLYSIFS